MEPNNDQQSLGSPASGVDSGDVGAVFEALQCTNGTINGFDEISCLEPVLEKIANALRVEKIIVAQRTNDTLIQRTHCDDDRLSQHLEDWNLLAEGRAYR